MNHERKIPPAGFFKGKNFLGKIPFV